MGLPIRIETRTGDTPASKRQRQRRDPPDILLTTPEQLALLLASRRCAAICSARSGASCSTNCTRWSPPSAAICSRSASRGCSASRPELTTVGLSATVAEPDDLCRFLVPQPRDGTAQRRPRRRRRRRARRTSPCWTPGEHLPWAGHSARHAFADIYELIRQHQTTLVFVNTRSQAEMIFQELWRINDDNLAIALHHGSLDVAQRRKVEDAMAAGRLRAVVCTSSLDLGVDWGDIDLVINVGAPKGASRLMQRIGRANHRLDEPSRGVLVPANRFEVLECRAAIDAVAEQRAGHAAAAHRRARRAGAACARLRLRRAVRRRRALRRGAGPPRPMRRSRAPTSTPRSISSPPAAMRCKATSASPRSGRARTAAGASPIRASRSATGSMSAPSSKPTC